MKTYTNQEFKFICELIWGGVPVDKNWVYQSELFKNNADKILDNYPMLDKSFFNK